MPAGSSATSFSSQRPRLSNRANIMKCVTKSMGTRKVGMYQADPIWLDASFKVPTVTAYSKSTAPTRLNNHTSGIALDQFARMRRDRRKRAGAAAPQPQGQEIPSRCGGTHAAGSARKALRVETFSPTRASVTILQSHSKQQSSRKTEVRILPLYPSVFTSKCSDSSDVREKEFVYTGKYAPNAF